MVAEIERLKAINNELAAKNHEIISNQRKGEFMLESLQSSYEESERRRGELQDMVKDKENQILTLSRKVFLGF